jgi:hypothetical protein
MMKAVHAPKMSNNRRWRQYTPPKFKNIKPLDSVGTQQKTSTDQQLSCKPENYTGSSFFFENNIQSTVKPRFNVPAFSEIPDLVMIFSCPDNTVCSRI